MDTGKFQLIWSVLNRLKSKKVKKGKERKMIVYYIIMIGFSIFCFYMAFKSYKIQQQEAVMKQKQKEIEQNRKLKEEEERKRMRKHIIEFAKRNGVNLESLYQQRDMYYNQAIRDLFVSKMAKPIEPTYQRGVVRGSLGDNIATIANAQKKADYEKAMAQNERTAQSARTEFSAYIRCAEKIISELKQIPDSQRYVEYEEKEYKETMKQIRAL